MKIRTESEHKLILLTSMKREKGPLFPLLEPINWLFPREVQKTLIDIDFDLEQMDGVAECAPSEMSGR